MAIVDDFQDIRSRMKGELKPAPVFSEYLIRDPAHSHFILGLGEPACLACQGRGTKALINGPLSGVYPCGRCSGTGIEP